jgi:hypothetical protein
VKSRKDIKPSLDYGIGIPGIIGIVIIVGKDMGVIGDVEFI